MALAEKRARALDRFKGIFRKKLPVAQELSPLEQKSKLESECEEILQKPDFGVEDFNHFAYNMVKLIAEPRELSRKFPFAILPDRESEREIVFSPQYRERGGGYSIIVRSYAKYLRNNRDEYVEGENYGRIDYMENSSDPKKLEPYLSSIFNVSLPQDIKYKSYMTDMFYPVFPEGKLYNEERTQLLTEEQVQAFCRKAYGVYCRSKQNIQSSPAVKPKYILIDF